MTKLEEVAAAICERRNADDWPCNGLDFDEEMARAAIKALMDHKPPTVFYVTETDSISLKREHCDEIWQAWLQAILDEESETV